MSKSGGPAVEELAREGDEDAIKFKASYFLNPNLISILLSLNLPDTKVNVLMLHRFR